ncbi:bestrophin-like domain [Photobacterium sp. Hal280]|uniref:bestrophin-like domain n=1 Tax=Photobacterium sp. Hal280 TaxID=3035163 RepID=UPI00301C25E7
MDVRFFESVPIFWLFIGIALLMLAFCEVGFQFGLHARTQQDKEAPSSLGPMVGGLLGMLAFVLAFTFSMATSQYEFRRNNVLQEANIIGTAYLRADLLGGAASNEVKSLLREYVDVRLEAVGGKGVDKAIAKSVEIHNRLWKQVSKAAIEKPSPTTSLVVQVINDVIDMHEIRITGALRNRIPFSIWISLAAITALAMIAIGTQVGYTGKRRLIAVIPMALAFAVLVTLVVDLNRPQSGLITVSQQSMVDLRSSMD